MRLILKKWKICFVPRRYWVENLHWMKGRQAIQPDIRIDYDFLREVEIYVPDIEYRTCFYSSQESGETWWPSKCHEWTFGLKPGYQQVREILKVHTCLPSAVGVSNISEIWVWYKVHFQFGGEGRCFFRWTSVFLYFRLKNTWRVNAASIYYVDILITTNESHVSELSSGKELLWIIFPLLLKALFRRISSKEIMPDLPPPPSGPPTHHHKENMPDFEP